MLAVPMTALALAGGFSCSGGLCSAPVRGEGDWLLGYNHALCQRCYATGFETLLPGERRHKIKGGVVLFAPGRRIVIRQHPGRFHYRVTGRPTTVYFHFHAR